MAGSSVHPRSARVEDALQCRGHSWVSHWVVCRMQWDNWDKTLAGGQYQTILGQDVGPPKLWALMPTPWPP